MIIRKMSKRAKIFSPIFIIGAFIGIFAYLNSKITTFEECERAGWLVQRIKVYASYGPIEKECVLWSGKVFYQSKAPEIINDKPAPALASAPIMDINLDERLKSCGSIPNGATQEIAETSRLFINLPEDIYPLESRKFTFNGATVGIITSGEGLPPENGSIEEFLKNKCVTRYYDFEGNGAVDLKVKSAVPGIPDYGIHFTVR